MDLEPPCILPGENTPLGKITLIADRSVTKAVGMYVEVVCHHKVNAAVFFALLQLIEEGKTMPWNAVYDEFCVRNGVPVGNEVIAAIKEYEKNVLSAR